MMRNHLSSRLARNLSALPFSKEIVSLISEVLNSAQLP
jgi:hypothetical protein